MHDGGIAKLDEGQAMLEKSIVTITMLETCKWTQKTPKALGYCTLKFDKKKPHPPFHMEKKGGAQKFD